MRKFILCILILISLSTIPIKGDEPKSNPPTIAITGENFQKIKEAYQQVIQANQGFQYALLEARYNLNVPKDYVVNLEKMQFEPKPSPPVPDKKK